MLDFFSQYPAIKWTLIGFGVLAILSKYLKFDPIDKLIDRIKPRKYKFEEINHLGDGRLNQLIEDFGEQHYNVVTNAFRQFNDSYRSFGFRALGQYADENTVEEWIQNVPESTLPKIVKAYQLVFKGWEVRGRQTIDAVSKENLAKYKDYLQKAKALLISVQDETEFKVNVNALLLKIYKAIDVDRATIHKTFSEVETDNQNHAELNFNYFAAISPKWGGTSEELNNYLNRLGTKSQFINNLILAQYYFDFVHISGGEDDDKQIKTFIDQMKLYKPDQDELYKYEFYLLLYWLSNNLEYQVSENYYKQQVQPFWKD